MVRHVCPRMYVHFYTQGHKCIGYVRFSRSHAVRLLFQPEPTIYFARVEFLINERKGGKNTK